MFMFGQIINTLLILNIQWNSVTQDATRDVGTWQPSSYFLIIYVFYDLLIQVPRYDRNFLYLGK
jgi:hypothetical protein